MQQMDQQRHDAYAREMIKNDKLGVLYQERQERDVRELQKVKISFLNYVIPFDPFFWHKLGMIWRCFHMNYLYLES